MIVPLLGFPESPARFMVASPCSVQFPFTFRFPVESVNACVDCRVPRLSSMVDLALVISILLLVAAL